MSAQERISWEEVAELCTELALRLAGQRFDALMGIARGGLVPAALIAQEMGIRNVLVAAAAGYEGDRRDAELAFLEFPADCAVTGRRVLVVDDIWDSGRTIEAVRARLRNVGAEVTVAVLHYKPRQSAYPDRMPDLWCRDTDNWIVYPWERDT